ncbi:unnamed protein product [Oncorhynchus mykiss]|uniref:SS18L1 subunit of BAF chromatin remodeling complex n=1 Tax=Oncorhynchus mykiss TaxID=8022 RepID=A0A060XFB3_ONCMY|nr:unnamed protein product [Oncorhynchus mykiss]
MNDKKNQTHSVHQTVSMMHQQSATPHYPSTQTGGGQQQYQGQQAAMGMLGQSGQGNNMMSQRPMGTYRPTQQGSAPQYMGQDDFYGEQYGHTQSSSEPINQQYYSDGHGEYSYQQSSYGEQGYERSFDESSQHYYEGGNSQYSQQQAQYQQGSGQQQPSANNSTPHSRATADSHRATVQVRERSPSTPSTSRVRASSTAPTAPRLPLGHRHRGPTPTNRVNMETTSNKAPPPGQTGGQVRQGNSSVNNPQQSCVNQSLSK